MAVVKINKLSVQEGMGEELERRFKNNSEKLDEVPTGRMKNHSATGSQTGTWCAISRW